MYLRSFAFVIVLLTGCADSESICEETRMRINFYEQCQRSEACNLTSREREKLLNARIEERRWCEQE